MPHQRRQLLNKLRPHHARPAHFKDGYPKILWANTCAIITQSISIETFVRDLNVLYIFSPRRVILSSQLSFNQKAITYRHFCMDVKTFGSEERVNSYTYTQHNSKRAQKSKTVTPCLGKVEFSLFSALFGIQS